MKRQRGRGRKPGGHNNNHHHHQPNRTMESNGPDGKVRGPAALIYERYLQMARDASSSGDRVMAENFLQHAEHYFRVLRAMQPAMPPPAPVGNDRFGGGDIDFDGDEDGESSEGGDNEGDQPIAAEGGGDQPDAEFASGQPQQGFDRDGDFRRNRGRGRRNRYRPGDSEGQGDGQREGGYEQRGDRPERSEPRAERPERSEPRAERPERSEQRADQPRAEREDRPERRERRERPPREPREPRGDGGEPPAAEGFSTGPRPAFLGSGD